MCFLAVFSSFILHVALTPDLLAHPLLFSHLKVTIHLRERWKEKKTEGGLRPKLDRGTTSHGWVKSSDMLGPRNHARRAAAVFNN